MTKQEVLNNIRYNEKLVNQYVNTISGLRSKINDRNTQINQYNAQIRQLRSQIKELKAQIDELNQLKSKYQKLQNAFISMSIVVDAEKPSLETETDKMVLEGYEMSDSNT